MILRAEACPPGVPTQLDYMIPPFHLRSCQSFSLSQHFCGICFAFEAYPRNLYLLAVLLHLPPGLLPDLVFPVPRLVLIHSYDLRRFSFLKDTRFPTGRVPSLTHPPLPPPLFFAHIIFARLLLPRSHPPFRLSFRRLVRMTFRHLLFLRPCIAFLFSFF